MAFQDVNGSSFLVLSTKPNKGLLGFSESGDFNTTEYTKNSLSDTFNKQNHLWQLSVMLCCRIVVLCHEDSFTVHKV